MNDEHDNAEMDRRMKRRLEEDEQFYPQDFEPDDFEEMNHNEANDYKDEN